MGRLKAYRGRLPSGGLETANIITETVKLAPPLPPYRHWDKVDVESLETMWAAGVSVAHMAGTLGRTEVSIRWKLASLRLTKEKLAKHPYEDGANEFIIWACDELEHQGIGQARVLAAIGKTYDRWYDVRMRCFAPTVPEITALLKLCGYKLVIEKDTAHNGTDNVDG